MTDNLLLGHPFVTGEVACGLLARRGEVIGLLIEIPQVVPALDSEVLPLIQGKALHKIGIGYVDAHLLASTPLTPGAIFWTRDKRLAAAAERLGVAA